MAMANPALKSYLDFLTQQRRDQWDLVKSYRAYANGEQTAQLSDKQKRLITGDASKDPEFTLNICATVLNVEVDRLKLRGINVIAPNDDAASERLTDLVAQWRKMSRTDAMDRHVHHAACRDGDGYLIPRYIEGKGPRLVLNEAYDGEGGVDIVYEDGSPNDPLYATKRWTVARPVVGNAHTPRVRRMNVYYPDRIEKYISNTSLHEAGWQPYDGDGDTVREVLEDEYGNMYEAAVVWMTDTGTATGAPLGLPVIHFAHNSQGGAYGRSSIADVVPGLQDAINLTSVSLLAATVLSGFKIITMTGVDRGTATQVEVFPGNILGVDDPTANIGQLAESNLQQLIEVKNGYIKDAAMLTNTPLSFFNVTGQVMAEGTLQQAEAGLLAKVEADQVAFGNAHEDAARLMLKMEAVYGTEVQLSLDQIDELEIECDWEPAQTRNDREVVDLAIKKLKDLGVPRTVAWSEVGYTPDEIAQMEQDAETQRNIVIGQLGQAIRDAEAETTAVQQARQSAVVAAPRNGNGAATEAVV